MFSPALRHRQKILARQSGAVEEPARKAAPAEPKGDTPAGQQYAALRVLLHENLRKLSDVQSIEARNPIKVEMARAFDAWIEGVLAAGEQGQAAQDEILVWNMVWALDYRDFDYALRLASHAMRFHLVMPERYNRTVACFVAEEIATVALTMKEAVSLDHLLRAFDLTKDADMPDPARAKIHKAIGRAYARKAEDFDPAAESAPAGGKAAYAQQALEHCQRAFALDSNIGVKTDIKTLERQLKALASADDGAAA